MGLLRLKNDLTVAEKFESKSAETRILAINVSIPNGTIARMEQFRSPQLRIQRERPTDAGVD